jgi:hypothetical protein
VVSARSAKDIIVKPIGAEEANAFIRRHHYSGKVVRNSLIHFGVFLDRRLEGVLQLGPSLDKRKIQGLVADTPWDGFLELNRMAFTDYLPRNSESRAIGVVIRILRKKYPSLKWLISYADACQCGDGTIYRASGFVLTACRPNKDLIRLPDGTVTHTLTVKTGKDRLAHFAKTGGSSTVKGEPLEGFQLRYIYFIDPAYRAKLTVPEVPFSRIREMGARMARGRKLSAEASSEDLGHHPGQGGAIPTPPLQSQTVAEAAQAKPAGRLRRLFGL